MKNTADRFKWQLECMVAWMCVLEKEYFAALKDLDEVYGTGIECGVINGLGDENIYRLGRIGHHKVVLTSPSGVTGQFEAYRIASDIKRTFPSIRFALIVGIGGGAPTAAKDRDIRLGDVVVSDRVVLYNSGKRTDHGFTITSAPMDTTKILLAAAASLAYDFMTKETLQELIAKPTAEVTTVRDIDYSRPKVDHLYKSDHLHHHDCRCQEEREEDKLLLVSRRLRPPHALVQMHRGIVGTADQVLREAKERDRLAEDEDIICFEMEAGGVMSAIKSTTKSVTVRGISDYADGHKNDVWHHYAALSAAVCAKALLGHVPTQLVAHEDRVFNGGALDYFVRGFMRHLQSGLWRFLATGMRDSSLLRDILDQIQILCIYMIGINTEGRVMDSCGCTDMKELNLRVGATEMAYKNLVPHIEQLRSLVRHNADIAPEIGRQEWEALNEKFERTAKEVDELRATAEAVMGLSSTGESSCDLGRATETSLTEEIYESITGDKETKNIPRELDSQNSMSLLPS